MILLTGGAGFIGSCLLKKLNEQGINNIMVVDHLGVGDKWKNLVGKRFSKYMQKEEFRYLLLDDDLEQFGIESIFHIGACSATTERDADYLFDNNLNYSIELAEFARQKNIRFIYASSAATYGDGSKGYSDNVFYSLKPLNAYGLTKHLFDLWVIDNKLDSVFTGLKFFNVFGPNEYHKGDMASMIYKSYHQILQTGKVKLFKSDAHEFPDGGQMRDFVYVKDVIDIMWNIYQTPDFGGIYNIGTGKARTWNDLVKAVFSAMGKEPEIEYIDMPDGLKKQYQNYTCADMAKLNSTSCRYEFHSLEESVKDYVQNFLVNNENF